MANSITYLYPHDPSGSAPTNKITKELHSIQFGGGKAVLIPNAAPFFTKSLRVYNANTNQDYREHIDYELGHVYPEGFEASGKGLHGSIVFVNESINPLVGIDYQTVGYKWGHSDKALSEELANQALNPLTRTWGMIEGLPETFPPVRHEDDVMDVKDFPAFLTVMDRLVEAVAGISEGNSKSFKDLEERLNNLTSKDVGLEFVRNYGIASDHDVEEGSSDSVYMTALRVKSMIENLVGQRLDQHIKNKEDPHDTTPEQIGLGKVNNYPIATKEIAEKGESNEHYLTPLLAYYMVKKYGNLEEVNQLKLEITNHKNNKENPHGITPEIIGTMSTDDIKTLIAKSVATDSTKFAGKTEQEWLSRFPSQSSIDTAINEMVSTLKTFNDYSDVPVPSMTVDTTSKKVATLLPLGKGFFLRRKDGVSITSPNLGLPDGALDGYRVFNGFDDQTVYAVKGNIIKPVGPRAAPIPDRFANNTSVDVRSVAESQNCLLVNTVDNKFYVYQVSDLKMGTGAEPKRVFDGVEGGGAFQGDRPLYTVVRGNDIEVYTEDNVRIAMATLGNYLSLDVLSIAGYNRHIAVSYMGDSKGIMAVYQYNDDASITNKATYISQSSGRVIQINKDVVMAFAPEFTKPVFTAIQNNGLSADYLYVDDYFEHIDQIALGSNAILLNDTRYGLHVLSDTPTDHYPRY